MNMLDNLWKKGQDFLGVKNPIICGAMTWISNFELCKAVSEAGAFPVLAGGNMEPAMFEQEIDKCIEHLKTPFAVNLITIAPKFKTHYEIILKKKVPFVVFAGNFPKKHDVEGVKAAGIKCFSFASSDQISDQMIRFGVDALILEGSESGGHIGHVALSVLLQQVLFKTDKVPVFVAGGISTGKMMAHMLLMGAAGVQMGTRFAASQESTAHPNFKEAFIKAKARHAISTPQYDSRIPVVAVRALKNKGMDAFGKLQLELLKKLEAGQITREQAQIEVESFWLGGLRKAAVDGDVDFGSMMAGQSVGLVEKVQPVKEIVHELITDAEKELESIKGKLCK